MSTSPPLGVTSLSPLATALCSAVVVLLHCVHGGFYIFEAFEYLSQTVIDSSVLTFAYRLLGFGPTVKRAMYSALGITDTWIAFWHITGLVRALRASIRFRRFLLDVPDEKIAANIKTKLTNLAHKTGLPAATRDAPRQIEADTATPTLRTKLSRWSGRVTTALRSVKREYFTMDGVHFESGANFRKTVEIITQINLLIRMSRMTSEQKINDLVVSVFVVNCWSTPLLRFVFRRAIDPLPSRVSRHIVGLLLASCFTVAVPGAIWAFGLPMAGIQAVMFDQVLSARVRYLMRHVLISEWSQVISTRVAACTAILGIETLKRKLTALSQRRNTSQVLAITHFAAAVDASSTLKPTTAEEPQLIEGSSPPEKQRCVCSLHAFNFVWFVLGVVVVALHVDARNETPLPTGFKCDMPMHPWLSSRVACAVLEINCYRGGLSGSADEMDHALLQIDVAMLSTLRFTHCPALTMPPRLQTLSNLALLEVYNCSIVAWTAQAALTTRHHPYLGSVWLISVTGIASLPVGLQDATFPTADIVISRSDLVDLPVSLVDSWPHMMSKLVVEHSRLTTFPTALLTISSLAISLAGNNLTDFPASALQGHGITYLSVAENPQLQSLPDTGWRAGLVDIRKTNISTAPAWMKAGGGYLLAGGTPLCRAVDPTSSPWLDCIAPPKGDQVSGLFPFGEIAPLRQP